MQGIELIRHLAKHHPDVAVVAVTKYAHPDSVVKLLDAGVQHLGESRVDHAQELFAQLDGYTFTKHFLGSVQSRKTKMIVQMFDVVQSVDSLKVARDISLHASALEKQMQILLQLNLTGEPQKSGFDVNSPDEIEAFSDAFEEMLGLPNLEIAGLMCMGKQDDPDVTRQVFMRLASLRQQLGLEHASMGMSDDYEVALACGSNMLRIGSALGLSSQKD